jgi:hypothetical protein
MLRWCHEQLAREVLLPPSPGLYNHFTSINFELVGVSHASFSLWGYSLSCSIPIEPIIQISYIQIDYIQIGIIQIMDYGSLTKSFLELTKKSTVWESTIKIPIADNEDSLLDSSSAARGGWSVTPDGVTKQPTHYPPGSCYMFDPDLNGEHLWEKLKGMLTKVGCVSGCSVVIRSSCQNKTNKRKATYLFCCCHGLLVEENGSIEYDGNNVGPSNVIKEHLKQVKTTGHSKKGKKRIMCTTYLLNRNCMY